MDKKLLLIVNPKAGKRRSREFFFDIFSLFSEAGYLVSLRQTQGPGDAARIARESAAGYDLVVCYGGDGTLNQVVNGLLELTDPPPLGYIAGGSTNDFAATLQLPADPVETARIILRSDVGALDVGRFNQRMFMYVASFGAFTKVSYSAPQNVKNDLGHFAYILEGVKDLSSLRYYPARIEADGEVFEGRFLFGAIANATSIGGLMKLKAEDVALDDGRFEMLLFPEPKNANDLNDMFRALLLQDYSGNGLILHHASQITVESPDELSWSLDGEFEGGGKRAEIVNLHRRLAVRMGQKKS